MKKIFALILAVTVLTCFAACGNAGSGDTSTAAETTAASGGASTSGGDSAPVYVTDTDGNTVLDEQGNPVTESGIKLVTGDVDAGWY